jgi:ribosomal protein S9
MASNGTITYDDFDIPIGALYGYTSTVSMAMLKNVDARGWVSWRDVGQSYDNYFCGAPLAISNTRDETAFGSVYLEWKYYGLLFTADPWVYTYADHTPDFDTKIEFNYDTGYSEQELFTSEAGLSFKIGNQPSNGMALMFIGNGTNGQVDFRYDGLAGYTGTPHSEWGNGVNISGYLELSNTNEYNLSITVTGGGVTETISHSGTTSATLGSFSFYNAGIDNDTEARVYRFIVTKSSTGESLGTSVLPLWSYLFDKMLVGLEFDGDNRTLATNDEWYPFTPLYDLSDGEPIALLSAKTGGSVDFFGNETKYELEFKPAVKDVASSLKTGKIYQECDGTYDAYGKYGEAFTADMFGIAPTINSDGSATVASSVLFREFNEAPIDVGDFVRIEQVIVTTHYLSESNILYIGFKDDGGSNPQAATVFGLDNGSGEYNVAISGAATDYHSEWYEETIGVTTTINRTSSTYDVEVTITGGGVTETISNSITIGTDYPLLELSFNAYGSVGVNTINEMYFVGDNFSNTCKIGSPTPNTWIIDGIDVPDPISIVPVLNTEIGGQSLNGNYVDIIGSENDYGDTIQITLPMSPEEARTLLDQLVNTRRGDAFTVTYSGAQYIFGRRHGDSVTATCKLADNAISVKHISAVTMEVTLSLQIQGVS